MHDETQYTLISMAEFTIIFFTNGFIFTCIICANITIQVAIYRKF